MQARLHMRMKSRFGIGLLLFAWLVQQQQVLLHASAMAQQGFLRATFCGLVSSPATLARLVAAAPPELLSALQAKNKPSTSPGNCSLCASGHIPVSAGAPSSPVLVFLLAQLPVAVLQLSLPTAKSWRIFQARAPPVI